MGRLLPYGVGYCFTEAEAGRGLAKMTSALTGTECSPRTKHRVGNRCSADPSLSLCVHRTTVSSATDMGAGPGQRQEGA